MIVVVLAKRFFDRGGAAFNVGERICLQDARAHELIANGVAVATAAYDAPPVDRMVAAAPAKRAYFKGARRAE